MKFGICLFFSPSAISSSELTIVPGTSQALNTCLFKESGKKMGGNPFLPDGYVSLTLENL